MEEKNPLCLAVIKVGTGECKEMLFRSVFEVFLEAQLGFILRQALQPCMSTSERRFMAFCPVQDYSQSLVFAWLCPYINLSVTCSPFKVSKLSKVMEHF